MRTAYECRHTLAYVSTSAITPRYPNVANDPRLLDVNAEKKRLQNIVRDGEWNGNNVSVEICQLKILSTAFQDGKLYLPKF
tara:strand:- start:380 stop:622 length:243 start_codon:yes stop_codon:yes gene_type:complete